MDLINFITDIYKSEAQTILNNIKNIDNNFLKSVAILEKAEKVVFTGIGKSGNIAQKAVATFNSLGIPSVFLHPIEALHGDLGLVNPNDVIIFISKSGSTEELINLYTILHQRNKIISIIGNNNSFLAENSDSYILFEIEKEACYMNLAPTNSTTITLVVCDALALSMAKIRNKTSKDFASNHPMGQLGRFTNLTVKQVMHKENNLPFVDINATFKEALIVMTDKALGCLCVVENKDNKKLLGIITDGDIRRALNENDEVKHLNINDIMTKNPISIFEKITLGEALSIMENRNSQINVLPVVNSGNEFIGIIRLHDIIKSGL